MFSRQNLPSSASQLSCDLRFPRLYPILDTELLGRRGLTAIDAARALLDAGVRILQFRHKGQYTRDVFEQAKLIADMCRDRGTSFIVDDRADVALLLDAGLHVGQDDLAPSDARRIIGPARVLGYSTHNQQQLRAALSEPADYLAFGPLYSTSSKRNPDPLVGLDELGRVRLLTDRPLIAIGGITRERAREALARGADSIAVIADLYPDPLNLASLKQRVQEWLTITG